MGLGLLYPGKQEVVEPTLEVRKTEANSFEKGS
jgi:hypothetical protein